MFHRRIASAVVVILTLLALPAFAQDDKPNGDDSKASVVLLEFETFNVDQAVIDEFYRSLHAIVEDHPDMHVEPGGDVGINDLIMTLGCETADADCLGGLGDFVEGDRIVFGSVQHSNGVYLFSLDMFDFQRSEFIRRVSDQTIEGDAHEVSNGINAVVEGFLYGDVGALEVSLSGASGADLLFDGEKIGQAPATVDQLPLGEHAVTVRTRNGQKQSKKVMLRRAKTAKVAFDFEGVADPAPGATTVGSKGYAVPGWAVAGLGTIGLVAGVIGTVQVDSYNSEANSMVCDDALCPSASTERANKLQSDMDSAYTMSVVGYSVAAVGLAAGGYLLYQAYSGSDVERGPATGDSEPNSGPQVNVGVAPNPGGASMGVHVGF